MTLRTDWLEADYAKLKETGVLPSLLDEPALFEWQYWRLILNRFPHNKMAIQHQMVVLKRETHVFAISPEELNELWYTILPWADNKYDIVKVNMASVRSVAAVPHIHLMTYAEQYK